MKEDVQIDQKGRNSVPILERTLDILAILRTAPRGASIRDLTERLHLPRSTVYRILNTLAERDIVSRAGDGAYQLSAQAPWQGRADGQRFHLEALVQPFLRTLGEKTGEATKVSVRAGDRVLIIAATAATRGYGLTPTVGLSLPLHVGAANKMVMAHLTADEIENFLAKPLQGFTPRTVTNPDKLRTELSRIRRQGWAHDRGEHRVNVHAFAAPIFDPNGNFLGALSVPFLSDKEVTELDALRDEVVGTAKAISAEIRE